MKNQRFGVEIEMKGLSQPEARAVLWDYFGGDFDHLGRKWEVIIDQSVPNGFELVTPPLYYADIFVLQDVFRRLRLQGAVRSRSAGLHIHVDAHDFSPYQIINLVYEYANYSDLLTKMFNVYTHRRVLYCQPILTFARRLRKLTDISYESIERLWYSLAGTEGPSRYDRSRYTELNLNSYFYRRTIEFRAFNSTNHAGKLRAFIIIILSLVESAKRYSGIIPLEPSLNRREDEAIQNARLLFEYLSIQTFEFHNDRRHLLKNIKRHFKKQSSERKKSYTFTASTGMKFDGGSYSEILDEMMDNYYFDQDDIRVLILDLRKKKGKKEPSLLYEQLRSRSHNAESFAQALIGYLEDNGVGVTNINGE